MPKPDRAFKTWRITLPATKSLPEGLAMVTVASAGFPRRLKSPVQSVYITIPERGDVVARTRNFDEERVVVEYDDDGEIIGLELLACVPLGKTPEIGRELKKPGHPHLLCAAFQTAWHLWHDLVLALRVAFEVGAEPPRPRAFRRASPESTVWHEDPRGEPLASGV